MSDPEQAPEPPKPAAVQRPTLVLAAFVLAGVLAIGLLVWIEGIKAAAMRREAFARGVDGLAASLSLPLLETRSVRFENRKSRLQGVLDAINREGRFVSVVVTDPEGTVVATTDTSLQGQKLPEGGMAKSPGTAKDVEGTVEVWTSVTTDGGEKIGALRVRIRF
ncbi:MAG: hypothetical protein JST30_08995 [Armatimonadetes bacterium]|nr:hypothetical protein [Armatimonadota bacterium]